MIRIKLSAARVRRQEAKAPAQEAHWRSNDGSPPPPWGRRSPHATPSPRKAPRMPWGAARPSCPIACSLPAGPATPSPRSESNVRHWQEAAAREGSLGSPCRSWVVLVCGKGDVSEARSWRVWRWFLVGSGSNVRPLGVAAGSFGSPSVPRRGSCRLRKQR
jgi:hypothetical protein